MAVDFNFRKRAVASLINDIGVYILADLDNVPLYVGQSKDGIRARVARHLTSARSDIIANRQIDVWEIAYVWAYPVTDRAEINALEAGLFHHFDPSSQLVNGALPPRTEPLERLPAPTQVVQVLSDEEILERKQPEQRLPRQANHYAQIVSHFLSVKNSTQIARAMNAHFERLNRYHSLLLGKAEVVSGESES
ncbi:GIY-YIG nuclease family protein [Rhizobium oryziradicis]|uniref:Excinuclease ABC subunit C n=1 Tax=Rhizobium oryziradicis TaxID=1867956 RepID=A0A1Q8ZT86_9HYPH|nr:GIY-YIG nuclease family protein [Rhizobium oryziradicis]OLP45283.1 excinuclease ABC subunit C [Rhizobium oryziradicis]